MPHCERLVRLTEKSRSPPRISPSASLPRNSGTIAPGAPRTSRADGPGTARGGRSSSPPRSTRPGACGSGTGRPVDQLVVGVVLLAGDAVLARVHVELDVAGVVAALQELCDGGLVARLGRADEVVVGDVQPLPGSTNFGAMPSANSCGVMPAASAACWILRPCSSVPVRNLTSSPSSRCQRVERVADDRRVGVAEVGLGVDVVDRGRQVEAAHARATLTVSAQPANARGSAIATVGGSVRTHGWHVCGATSVRRRTCRRDGDRRAVDEQPASGHVRRRDHGWDIGGNANGGYLLALAGRAMADDGRTPAAHGHRPLPRPGAGRAVRGRGRRRSRSGRRLATVTAILRMGGPR